MKIIKQHDIFLKTDSCDVVFYTLQAIRRSGFPNLFVGKLDDGSEVQMSFYVLGETIEIGDEVSYFNSKGIGSWGYVVDILPNGVSSGQYNISVINNTLDTQEVIEWGYWILI